jgi:hypothetical protein
MSNKTLGGISCPLHSSISVDRCLRCTKHICLINDQRVYDGCQCLTPRYEKGMSLKVDTDKIVDAINIKYDQFDEVKS